MRAGLRELRGKARRGRRVAGAFMRMGYLDTIAYPMSLVVGEFGALIPAVTFYFISQLLDQDSTRVGGDYYTFVIIGLVVMRLLASALQGFGRELEKLINQGRFEILLVEPVPWRFLPFGMAQWDIVKTAVLTSGMIGLAIVLGADFRAEGFIPGVLILLLGLIASLGVSIADTSIRILAKKGDPILALYTMAASVFSGALFPIELLPAPLRLVSYLVPHTYVIQALRKILMPEGHLLEGPSALEAVGALVLFCAIIYPIALWAFGKALNYGRRLGVLSGY